MKKLVFLSIITFFSVFLFSACINSFKKQEPIPSPSPDASPEVLGETNDFISAPSIGLEEGQDLYVVDLEKSTVSWAARKIVGAKHNGGVKLAAGNIVIEEEKFVRADFVLDMLSLYDESLEGQQNQILENHLKSEDFFAVDQYPVAELIINSAELQDDGDYNLTGLLTIKDKSNKINFPAQISLVDGIITANAKFSIDRTLWDIKYGSDKFFDNLADNVIEDNIDFEVSIVAQK